MVIQSAEQAKISLITFTSDRLTRPLVLSSIDPGSNVVAELNIYENITSGFLTGTIVFQDDQDIYRTLLMDGTERVAVTFSFPGSTDEPVTKTFIAANVQSLSKLNDYTSVITMNLIEDIGFFDKVQKISKYYDGTGEQIIEKICKDKLYKNVNKTYLKQSAQSAFRYIIPYKTPLEAIKTILYKMTTQNGLPYFFFSSINSNDFILTDLESIYGKEVFNLNQPFEYSQGTTNSRSVDIHNTLYTIYEYTGNNLENTLKLAQAGGIGSLYTGINISTGNRYSSHIDMYDQFENLKDNNILPPGYNQSFPFNNLFTPDPSGNDDRKLVRYDSKINSSITVSGTYAYDNLNSLFEEDRESDHRLRYIRDGFLTNLLKNTYQIHVPGLLFLQKSLTNIVGSQINIRVYRAIVPDARTNPASVVDETKSGNYLILAKRHIFNVPNQTHTVSMEISRLSNQEKTE